MFKSKEELMKKDNAETKLDDNHHWYNKGVSDAFKSIAERIKFYEDHIIEDTPDEYIGALSQVEKQYPKLYTEFIKQIKFGWNEWLFHICFDGVK